MRKLYKSKKDKKLCGVCGGLAEYLDMDSTIIRLIMALCIIFGGLSVFIYIIMALIIPFDDSSNLTSI